MNLIADILLVAGALGAGIYCFVLARRLSKFNDLEAGVGGAVAVLSAQVDDMTRTLKVAQQTAGKSTQRLEALTQRAEGVSKRLELMLAAMHDLPETSEVGVANAQGEAAVSDLMAETSALASDDADLTSEAEEAFDEEFVQVASEADSKEKRRRKAKKKEKQKAKRKAAKEAASKSSRKKKSAKPEPEESAPSTPVFTRHVA
ncbi:hypothetical protein NBRC116594_20000 [Shimia sp. NS0008-38b]